MFCGPIDDVRRAVRERQHSKYADEANLDLSGRTSVTSILSTKWQKSMLIFSNQVIWGRSANIGLQ